MGLDAARTGVELGKLWVWKLGKFGNASGFDRLRTRGRIDAPRLGKLENKRVLEISEMILYNGFVS